MPTGQACVLPSGGGEVAQEGAVSVGAAAEK